MNTLTRERIEQIREYALAGKVDTILVREQECVALCNHALSDLRRESAAPDGGLSPLEIERWRKVMLSHWVADEDGKWLTREESTRQANAMANMALRSLERLQGPWSHWTEPHCSGCWVISVENGGPVAKCNECALTVDLLTLLEQHTMRLSQDVSMPFSGSMERKV